MTSKPTWSNTCWVFDHVGFFVGSGRRGTARVSPGPKSMEKHDLIKRGSHAGSALVAKSDRVKSIRQGKR